MREDVNKMPSLQLDHADRIYKALSNANLPDAARTYTPKDIAETRWSQDEMLRLDPVFFEVRKIKRGRWAKKKPKNYAIRHLLDAQGRILAMIEEHDFGEGRVRVDEALVQRAKGQTVVAHIEGGGATYDPRLELVEWANSESAGSPDADREGVGPTRVQVRHANFATDMHLYYENGLLTRIERKDEDTRLSAGTIDTSTIRITYDSLGRRECIEQFWQNDKTGDEESMVIFQTKVGAPSIKDATARMRKTLRDAATAALRTMAIDEPVWCVKLLYPDPSDALSPSVVACTASKRNEIIASGSEPTEVWNETLYPQEHQAHDIAEHTDAPALAMLTSVLEVLPEAKQVRLIRDVAADLAADTCSRTITPTDDFAVIAIDMPHDDFNKAARACVPKPILKKWKAAGIA